MWISRKEFEALKRRVEELEKGPKMLTDLGKQQSCWAVFAPLPDSYHVRQSDVIRAIVEHLGMEIEKTAEKPPVVELREKPKLPAQASYFFSPAQAGFACTPEPEKKPAAKRRK